ncbi:MAG: hypothetical protein H6Q10_368 [Acidobacteria bacterium]|nr:hypothetical protein [Acidobacteriota bacterium]
MHRMTSRASTLSSIAVAFAFVLGLCAPAFAQQRPLVTQDPEAIGAGNVLVEAGVDYGNGIYFPASGLEGNLWRVPMLGVVVGVGSMAEIQLTGGYKRLSITDRREAPLADEVAPGDTTSAVEDLVIGTKLRLLAEREGVPAVALRIATRLPNASEASGIALDTTEFYASFLVGKTIRSTRVALNAGLGILPDPVNASRQNDVLTYGLSLVQAVEERFDVVAEVNGRLNTRGDEAPVGTESQGALRGGARFTIGSARLDAGLVVGLTSRDPNIGFTAGFTYMFKAFNVQ